MIKIALLILTSLTLMQSCIIVKHEYIEDDVAPMLELSPKPEVAMSDMLVRSELGDMIAFLPQGWFFVDVEDGSSAEVFAVAVNKDYTLSAIFSKVRSTDEIDNITKTEGLLGLARMSLDRHIRKAGGQVRLAGQYNEIHLGNLRFAKFNFTSKGGGAIASAAVFQSSLNQYYEFALMPLNFTRRPLPSSQEIQSIFNSILTTIQY